ncbi:DUF6069 family protein [Amycolatopsis aidingensis]|uniref:DUF6069 family protein n=1 Tax=Amycolatopsis aidingensis TaxID=2842453 RepID=UPI001C0D483C|nr:DUF6069 family protein [Amycolatopsis aidingensis]
MTESSYYYGGGEYDDADKPTVNARTLWFGGLATALVAALTAVLAVLVVEGVFDIPVLAPSNAEGAIDHVSALWLAMFAAIGALVATALAHVLLMFAPRPMAFCGWIIALITAFLVVWPFTIDLRLETQIANAAIYLVIGIAIGSLVTSMANRAVRRHPQYPHQ